MEKLAVNTPLWVVHFLCFSTGFIFYIYGACLSFWRIRASERTGGLYPKPFRKFITLYSWVGFFIGTLFYVASLSSRNKEKFWAIPIFFMLTGCYQSNQQGAVIARYETTGEKCEYQIKTSSFPVRYSYFIDTCGAFNKGDTVVWRKKHEN